MANFQSTSQYDVFNIIPLQDPLTRTAIDGGFHMADPAGDFVDVRGNLSLDSQNDLVGTLNSVDHYFSTNINYYTFSNLDADMLTGGNYYENGYTIGGQTFYAETAETAYWLRGNDVLNGSVYNDVLAGFSGNDMVYGGDGLDLLSGYDGDDYLDGGAGNDVLRGSLGNDELLGGLNADTLFGGQGNDLLRGGGGLDMLDGGVGDDILLGALGTDTLTGGQGSDTFRFNTALDGVINIDTITDFVSGVDTIELAASIFSAFADQVGQRVGLGEGLTYDQSSGYLYFNPNISDASPGIPFAILGGGSHPAIANDFLIV